MFIVLITKQWLLNSVIKKKPITRAEGGTFKSPSFLPHVQVPIGRLVLEAKNSNFEPSHIVCQRSLGRDNVDGVKAMF